MSISRERNTCKGHKFTYRIVSQSAYEGRSLFKAGALMGAIGLSLSAVIAAAPFTTVNAKTVNIDVAASSVYVEPVNESDVILSSESFLLLNAVNAKNEANGSSASSFKATELDTKIAECVSEISDEEANQKLEGIIQYAQISSTIYTSNSKQPTDTASYVSLNTDGRAMSEKTAPQWLQLDENGIPTQYKKCIQGNSTAYYSGYRTATGTTPMQGTVAVNPKLIPYGTKMYITSSDGRYIYGYCVAEDTGGFIYFRNGATVDLYMHSYDDCVQWGWRSVNIYILE